MLPHTSNSKIVWASRQIFHPRHPKCSRNSRSSLFIHSVSMITINWTLRSFTSLMYILMTQTLNLSSLVCTPSWRKKAKKNDWQGYVYEIFWLGTNIISSLIYERVCISLLTKRVLKLIRYFIYLLFASSSPFTRPLASRSLCFSIKKP